MRIATYNVEWFTNLFDRRGRLLDDDQWSSRYNVTRAQQLGGLGIVFTAINADAVLIVEAPDDNSRRKTVPMLESFAAYFNLRQRRALIGFSNETQQQIALLYDPDAVSAVFDPQEGTEDCPRFDRSLKIDLDIDDTLDTVTFSKPPLEVALTTRAGKTVRLIGVHIKSKAPHGEIDATSEVRIAIENRRKQLAQCIWLRRRIDAHLDAGDSLIVLGDFNDGPGLDEYEQLFGRSGLEDCGGRGQSARAADARPACAAAAQPFAGRPACLGPVLAARGASVFLGDAGLRAALARPVRRRSGLADLAPVRRPGLLSHARAARSLAAGLGSFPGDGGHSDLSPHIGGMTRIALIALLGSLSLTPALAEEAPAVPEAAPPAAEEEAPGLIEQGARMFLRGLIEEIGPQVDEMTSGIEEAARKLGPELERLMALVDDVKNYEPPERLPNGDIVIRRKSGAPPPPPLPEGKDEAPDTDAPAVPEAPQIDL